MLSMNHFETIKKKKKISFAIINNHHHTATRLFDNAIVEFCGCSSVKINVDCIFGSSKHGKALKK